MEPSPKKAFGADSQHYTAYTMYSLCSTIDWLTESNVPKVTLGLREDTVLLWNNFDTKIYACLKYTSYANIYAIHFYQNAAAMAGSQTPDLVLNSRSPQPLRSCNG